MRAVGIESFGGREKLEVLDLPLPEPESGKILVRVAASGVGPWDIKTREGLFGERKFPFALGSEGSGVVEEVVGADTDFSAGDEVYFSGGGSYAQYAAPSAANVASKPERLTLEEAGSVPISGCTAYQGLLEEVSLKEGETILITGASGGVGTMAVQIAHDLGASVIGTASERNHEYLRSLGADVAVDYNEADWTGGVRETSSGGVDAVLDCVGGQTFEQSFEAIRDGGRLVSIAEFRQDFEPGRGISQHAFGARSDREQLEAVAPMINDGRLRVEIEEIMTLEDAVRAHERIEAGHVRGKIVLRVS